MNGGRKKKTGSLGPRTQMSAVYFLTKVIIYQVWVLKFPFERVGLYWPLYIHF